MLIAARKPRFIATHGRCQLNVAVVAGGRHAQVLHELPTETHQVATPGYSRLPGYHNEEFTSWCLVPGLCASDLWAWIHYGLLKATSLQHEHEPLLQPCEGHQRDWLHPSGATGCWD